MKSFHRFSMVWRLPGEKSAERNRTKTKPSGGGGQGPAVSQT